MKIVSYLTSDWFKGVHDALCPERNSRHKEAMELCRTYELVPVDTDSQCWQNQGDTLVLGIPDISDAELLSNAPEWINEWSSDLMKIVALLKPDEFDVARLDVASQTAKDKYAYAARFWWD